MPFGSDPVSENKLSPKVVIQSPQTEKLKGIWFEKSYFCIVLYCPLYKKNKNELL